MAASQLSRAVELRAGRRPVLSDLRESGDIEADADLVMLAYRERYYNPDTLDFTAEINVAKHRNGRTGMVKLYFHEASTGFKALAREGV
jgi:replicative DNA helicase